MSSTWGLGLSSMSIPLHLGPDLADLRYLGVPVERALTIHLCPLQLGRVMDLAALLHYLEALAVKFGLVSRCRIHLTADVGGAILSSWSKCCSLPTQERSVGWLVRCVRLEGRVEGRGSSSGWGNFLYSDPLSFLLALRALAKPGRHRNTRCKPLCPLVRGLP